MLYKIAWPQIEVFRFGDHDRSKFSFGYVIRSLMSPTVHSEKETPGRKETDSLEVGFQYVRNSAAMSLRVILLRPVADPEYRVSNHSNEPLKFKLKDSLLFGVNVGVKLILRELTSSMLLFQIGGVSPVMLTEVPVLCEWA